LSKQDPQLGEKVYVSGFPYNSYIGGHNFTAGIVSQESGLDQDLTRFQVDASMQPGNSGGPIFNENGSVIGISVQTLDPFKVMKVSDSVPQNVNFGIKQSIIRRLLEQEDIDFSEGFTFFSSDAKKIANLAKKGTLLIKCLE